MSNHGFVKTKKFMSAERISQMLDELNESHFKGILGYDYHESTADEPGWGPHTWLLKYVGSDWEWYRHNDSLRVCWLNTRRSFEMRHGGGGGHFVWWIDSVVLNEVAVRFNGIISDEGISDKWPGDADYARTYQDYEDRVFKRHKDEQLKLALRQQEQKFFVPPDFQVDLGPEIKIEMAGFTE